MPLFEDRSAAFIVRVWCESGGEVPGAVRAWRGSIEHVASGQRSFFTELEAVTAFMTPHLRRLGIEEPSRFWERVDEDVAAGALAAASAPPAPTPAAAAPKAPRPGR